MYLQIILRIQLFLKRLEVASHGWLAREHGNTQRKSDESRSFAFMDMKERPTCFKNNMEFIFCKSKIVNCPKGLLSRSRPWRMCVIIDFVLLQPSASPNSIHGCYRSFIIDFFFNFKGEFLLHVTPFLESFDFVARICILCFFPRHRNVGKPFCPTDILASVQIRYTVCMLPVP
jgi:hypothetical protein